MLHLLPWESAHINMNRCPESGNSFHWEMTDILDILIQLWKFLESISSIGILLVLLTEKLLAYLGMLAIMKKKKANLYSDRI